MSSINIQRLQTVAAALEELKDRVVFVGGAVAELYATDPENTEIRISEDIDCIIQLASRSEYYKLEDELRKKGFKNDTSSGAPICRWIFDGIKVDVMPANESIIGFSNQWYNKGLLSIVMKSLPDSNTIAVLSPAYYLASKFEAHYSRGGHDLRQSRDFADIVYVIENCESILEEISDSDNEVKVYLAASCGKLLRRDDLKEGIECVQSYSGSVDAEVIIDLINKIYASGE